MMTFDYEFMPSLEAVRQKIEECEGKHVQQAIFSTYMGTLTQICFTCGKVRSTISWEGNRSWSEVTGFKKEDSFNQVPPNWT